MSTKTTTAILLAALMAGSAIPVVAQPTETERTYEYNYQKNSTTTSQSSNDQYGRDNQYQDSQTATDQYQNNPPNDDRYDNPPPPDDRYGPPPPRDDRFGEGYDRGYREGAENERYRHDYRAADADAFYRNCRQQRAGNQAGGLIIGALAGGLIGNAISGGRGPGTVIGAIGGGALGASVGGDLSCEDRGYAYNVYYGGFERGKRNARYDWRNPRSGAYGYLDVGEYYRDRDGFRCATYTQTIYVHGRREVAHGNACRQRDGYWAFVS